MKNYRITKCQYAELHLFIPLNNSVKSTGLIILILHMEKRKF